MEKTRNDYEREEEKKKDRRVLMVIIPIILLILFCQWLFKSVEKDISKTYEGFMVLADGTEGQKVTVELEGTATYASMFSDELESYHCDIIVKDISGNILLDCSSSLDTIDSELDWEWTLAFLTVFDAENNSIEHIGSFIFDDLFKEILLKLDDGTYIALPASNLEEAKAVYINRTTLDIE